MKRFYISVGLIVLMAGLSSLHVWHLNGLTEQLTALLTQAQEQVAQENWEEAARLTRFRDFHTLTVQVERGEPANDLLAAALTVLGCTVQRGSRKGLPTFSADWGGFRLTAWDEEGRLIPPDRVLVLLTRIEMEHGRGAAALPSWAPAAAEQVAESFGGRLLRLGRDGEEAMTLWREQPWLWDGIFAACRLASRISSSL